MEKMQNRLTTALNDNDRAPARTVVESVMNPLFITRP
jgi:hypothetical protein